MRIGFGLAVGVAVLLGPAPGLAQATDACSFFTQDEFAELSGRMAWVEPTPMTYRSGHICGYDSGQVIVFSGPAAETDWEAMMASFGENPERSPAPEAAPDAYSFLIEPENQYQSGGAFVVFEAADRLVAVSVDAEDGEAVETALPAAIRVAQAVAAKLY